MQSCTSHMNLAVCSREKAGEAVDPVKTGSANISDDEGAHSKKSKSGFSAFASFADTEDVGAFEEDEEGAGGLMVNIRINFCFKSTGYADVHI